MPRLYRGTMRDENTGPMPPLRWSRDVPTRRHSPVYSTSLSTSSASQSGAQYLPGSWHKSGGTPGIRRLRSWWRCGNQGADAGQTEAWRGRWEGPCRVRHWSKSEDERMVREIRTSRSVNSQQELEPFIGRSGESEVTITLLIEDEDRKDLLSWTLYSWSTEPFCLCHWFGQLPRVYGMSGLGRDMRKVLARGPPAC